MAFPLLMVSCNEKPAAVKTAQNTVYATVNGEEIMSEEMEYFKSRSKADIINEYAEKYGVKDFSDFWDKEFDGKTPNEALNEKALSQAVDAKIRLVLMKENGVYDDITFSGLRKKAEEYNKTHENAQGNVGIKTVDLNSFYTYYISTGEMELKNILAESTLKPTQEEFDAQRNKNSELTDEGIISVIVDAKYEKLIDEKIKSAKVEIS